MVNQNKESGCDGVDQLQTRRKTTPIKLEKNGKNGTIKISPIFPIFWQISGLFPISSWQRNRKGMVHKRTKRQQVKVLQADGAFL